MSGILRNVAEHYSLLYLHDVWVLTVVIIRTHIYQALLSQIKAASVYFEKDTCTATMSSKKKPRRAADSTGSSAATGLDPVLRAKLERERLERIAHKTPRPFSKMSNELNSMILRYNPLKDLMKFAQTNRRHRAQVHEELRRRAKLAGFTVDNNTTVDDLIALNRYIQEYDDVNREKIYTVTLMEIYIEVFCFGLGDISRPSVLHYFLEKFVQDTLQDFIVYACCKKFMPNGLAAFLSFKRAHPGSYIMRLNDIHYMFISSVLATYENPPRVVTDSRRLSKWIPFVRYVMINYFNWIYRGLQTKTDFPALREMCNGYCDPREPTKGRTMRILRRTFEKERIPNCNRPNDLTFEDLVRVAPADMIFQWKQYSRNGWKKKYRSYGNARPTPNPLWQSAGPQREARSSSQSIQDDEQTPDGDSDPGTDVDV